MLAWVAAHQALSAIIGFWLFSNFVGGMPTPNDKSSMAYKWAFTTLHSLAGGIPRIAATFLPPQYAKFFGAANGGSTAT